MKDRKMVKWQPFDSVMDSKKIVIELSDKLENKKIPVLSDDQLDEIEKNIIKAYECKEAINIKYFKEGKELFFKDYIKNIDTIKKRITFENHSLLYFNQIIKAYLD